MHTNPATATLAPLSADTTCDHLVEDLVTAARAGDGAAWHALTTRFAGLVRATARRYRLSDADADDVAQNVWLLLFEHIDKIREPKAVAGWIAVTAARECGRTVGRGRRMVSVDPTEPAGLDRVGGGEWAERSDEADDLDAGIVREETRRAIRAGLEQLPERSQALLLLLAQDEDLSYAEISRRLGMPIGSIGPTRARCLWRLSQTAAVREFVDAA